MATPMAINKDPNHKNPRLEFPIKPHTNTNSHHSHSHSHSHAHSPSFLLHNGFNSEDLPDSDIEMITIPSVTYTSLKDLLPSSSTTSPPSAITPAMMMMINSSWYDEIPIKNPLVKHAALAYLQPMSTPREVRRKGIFGRLKDKCTCCCDDDDGCGGGFFGCFSWINDVVFAGVKDVFFCERRRSGVVVVEVEEEEYDEEEDEDDDDDVDDDEKVD